MDQLYFYVRKMDAILSTLKTTLNQMEDKYTRQQGPNLETNIINYFLRSKDNLDLASLIVQKDGNVSENEDDESSTDDSSNLQKCDDDDMESDDETVDILDDDKKCGTILEKAWIRRSKALRTDVAIAGWMCSPHPEIMDDCSKHHEGEHKNAVTRLLKKWFCQDVSKMKIFFLCFLFILILSILF